jgi:hypothetical protein
MTTTEYLCRHFSRMGARLKIQGPGVRQGEKFRIDVGRDRGGEFFDVRCQDGIVSEILDVRPASRHLVLMVRDGGDKNKFLHGRDERYWFAAAVPGDGVHDVRTAIASLRPLMRRPSVTVVVSSAYPNGLTEPEYNRLIDTSPKARRMSWRRMVRDAQVCAGRCTPS